MPQAPYVAALGWGSSSRCQTQACPLGSAADATRHTTARAARQDLGYKSLLELASRVVPEPRSPGMNPGQVRHPAPRAATQGA